MTAASPLTSKAPAVRVARIAVVGAARRPQVVQEQEAGARVDERLRRLPDELRDDPLPQLRLAARRARAAYGPKDSIRDAFSPDVTEPVLDATDRLLPSIARSELHRQ